jgi:hypothetical protein
LDRWIEFAETICVNRSGCRIVDAIREATSSTDPDYVPYQLAEVAGDIGDALLDYAILDARTSRSK